MKFIIVNILLICCFSLTVLPGVAALDNQLSEVQCCSSDCEEDTKAKDNEHDCTSEICNPFTHCSCCVGFVTSPVIVCNGFISAIEILTQEKIPFQEDLFIKSPWQPPKHG